MQRSRNNRTVQMDALESRTLYSAGGSFQTVGYLPDYRAGTNVNWAAITQINYFSVNPDASGRLPGTGANVTHANVSQTGNGDTTGGHDLSELAALVQTAHSHGVKIDVVIGGADNFSDPLTAIVKNPALQNTFGNSVVRFCQNYGIDGVDLDWEPNTVSSRDIRSYDTIISTLRGKMHHELDLSAAVNAEKIDMVDDKGTLLYDSKGNNVLQYLLDSQAVHQLTSINVMAYDLDSTDASFIGRTEGDMIGWANQLKTDGVSSSKLVFGVPFYAHDYNNFSNEITYQQLVDDNGGVEPTPTAPDNQGNIVLGTVVDDTTWMFDNKADLDAKTQFAISQGYRGMACWELGQDYYNSDTGVQGQLLTQIHSTILANTGTVTGKVFNDINHDGIRESGENGLAGFVVYIDMNADNSRRGNLADNDFTAITDSNGNYTFKNLIPGTYTIRIAHTVSGYGPTTAPSDIVTAGYGSTQTSVNFGELHI